MWLFGRRLSGVLYMVTCWLALEAPAQPAIFPGTPPGTGSVREELRAQVHHADSAGDAGPRIEARLALAAILPPKEAVGLYVEALNLADSSGRWTEAIHARAALAELHASRGRADQAYAEARMALMLSERMYADSLRVVTQEAQAGRERWTMQRDSLAGALASLADGSEQRLAEVGREAARWRWAFFGATLGALLFILFQVRTNTRVLGVHRRELDLLRAQLQAFTERERNRSRVSPGPGGAAAHPPASVPVTGPLPPLEPVLVAMFRSQAPERLATLQDARSRSDHLKVQRVVHTLKPQLVNFEASFAPLCARLVEPGAPADVQRWNADLDALEEGVRRLLA